MTERTRPGVLSTTIGGQHFAWGTRTYVMGIINVTPDSFSGDGLGDDVAAAVAQGLRFVREGADLLDVGGASTRPGFAETPVEVEAARALPVIERLVREVRVPVSIDTVHANLADRAVAAGATMVNDIWGLRGDPDMAGVIAKHGIACVLMHNQRGRRFQDVAGDILAGWRETQAIATGLSIGDSRIILDPGFGFGWSEAQNLEMLRRLAELREPGHPLLVGTSRKSTIGRALGDLPVDQRLEGTAASVAIAVANGADIVRVHDVREMVRVVRVADAIVRPGNAGYLG